MEILDFHLDERSRVSFDLRLSQPEWSQWLQKAGRELEKTHALKAADGGHMKRLYQTAASLAQQELVPRVCEQRNLLPVSPPMITVVTADVSGFEAIIRFAVYPTVRDFPYRGLSAKKPHRIISEADIDRESEHFRRNHLRVYETDREARTGDIAEVAFTGTSAGKSFPYDHSEKSRFLLGSGQLFAGLDEALLGHRAGDVLTLSLTMPKDFHRSDVAGMTLDLVVTLRGVWARDLQPMSDAFVRENAPGCDSVEAFRNRLRIRLEEVYEVRSQGFFRQNLEAALADALTTPVPDEMMRANFDRYLAGLASAASQSGKTLEALLKEEGKTLEDYQREIFILARRQVRLSLAVDYIAEKEGLTVSEDEIRAFVAGSAGEMDLPKEQVAEMLGGADGIAQELIHRKVMALVSDAAHAEVEETARFEGEDPAQPVLVNY